MELKYIVELLERGYNKLFSATTGEWFEDTFISGDRLLMLRPDIAEPDKFRLIPNSDSIQVLYYTMFSGDAITIEELIKRSDEFEKELKRVGIKE